MGISKYIITNNIDLHACRYTVWIQGVIIFIKYTPSNVKYVAQAQEATLGQEAMQTRTGGNVCSRPLKWGLGEQPPEAVGALTFQRHSNYFKHEIYGEY